MSSTQPPNYVEPKYLLSDIPHLESGWAVDQAIVTEDRLVCIRFGVPEADEVILMDRTLAKIQRRVINFCVIYAVDIEQVPDFNDLYGLSNDSLSVIWFFKNRHIPVDFRTGDNNKLSQHIPDTDVMIELLNKIYIGVQRKSGSIYMLFSVCFAQFRTKWLLNMSVGFLSSFSFRFLLTAFNDDDANDICLPSPF